MSITRKLAKLILTLLTLPLLVVVWLMVRDVPSLLFGMDILSAGQCAAGNSSAFVPDETIAGDRSTSNADRWICDFYDSAGGRQCGGIFGTGNSNDSASMVHIRRGET